MPRRKIDRQDAVMFTIADYDKRYRPYDKAGRELVNPSFVKLPINPKGDGLRTLLKYKRGGEVFCIWCLLLEKTTAEKQPDNRGKLLNHKGEPASVAEIAEGISHDRRIPLVKYALSVLASMGWVKCGQNEDIASTERCPNISVVKLSEDKKRGFRPPSLLDVQNYIKEKKYRFVNAESFISFYGSNGWMVGKNKMTSWHQALAGWEAREKAKHPEQQKTSSSPIQTAQCAICHKPAGTSYRLDLNRKPIHLCSVCDKAARLMGSFSNRPISIADLERRIEQSKAKMADVKRSTPKPKDRELVAADKQQVAIQKLVKETADNLGKGAK